LWKYAKGHKWHSTLKIVKNSNSWCPFCRLHKRENLCREIASKYLGTPSENRKPDVLKTSEYPTGLQLDIPYYDYGFAIEVQKNIYNFFIKEIPIILSNSKSGINSRKNYAKKIGSF